MFGNNSLESKTKMKGNLLLFWTQVISPLLGLSSLCQYSSLLFFLSFCSFGHSLLWLSLLCYCTYKGCLVIFFSHSISLGRKTDSNGGDKHHFLILTSCPTMRGLVQQVEYLAARRERHQPFPFFLSLLHALRSRNSTVSLKEVRKEGRENKKRSNPSFSLLAPKKTGPGLS